MNRAIIDHLRIACAGSSQNTAMSPVVAQQCVTAFKIIAGMQCGDVGKQKLNALKNNANFFRSECIKVNSKINHHHTVTQLIFSSFALY
jgi:7-keto-8-aminopelargonate synthetase-like enzyme